MEDYNKNDNNHLGVREEEETTNKTFMRKRSSLKPRSSIKDSSLKFDENNVNKTLKKKITWGSNIEEESEIDLAAKKSPEKSYDKAKTCFSEIVIII